MMMTVAQYAESRDLSEATVKKHIKKLELDLPDNPGDRRQRLISNDHQKALDQSTRRQPPIVVAAVEAEIMPEVTPYHRTEETGLMIANGAILEAQLTTYQTPQENPLLQALKAKVLQLEQSNALRQEQTIAAIQSQQDTNTAISAVRRMQIVEAAQRRAVEEFQMSQQIEHQTRTELEMMALGLTPAPNQPTASPLQTVPQSSASSPSPEWL